MLPSRCRGHQRCPPAMVRGQNEAGVPETQLATTSGFVWGCWAEVVIGSMRTCSKLLGVRKIGFRR